MNTTNKSRLTCTFTVKVLWEQSEVISATVTCACGDTFAYDTDYGCGSPQHVECPSCDRVLQLNDDMLVLPITGGVVPAEPEPTQMGPRAYIDWVDSDLKIEAKLSCGVTLEIDYWHSGFITCPICRKQISLGAIVSVTVLSAEQAGNVPVIQ